MKTKNWIIYGVIFIAVAGAFLLVTRNTLYTQDYIET